MGRAEVQSQGKCNGLYWEEGPLKEENDFEIRDKVKDKFQPYNFSFRPDPAKGDMIYITMTFFITALFIKVRNYSNMSIQQWIS